MAKRRSIRMPDVFLQEKTADKPILTRLERLGHNYKFPRDNPNRNTNVQTNNFLIDLNENFNSDKIKNISPRIKARKLEKLIKEGFKS